MFKKFASSSVSSSTLLKSSDQRRARTALIDAYPEIEEEIKEIFPKKGAMTVAKSSEANLLLDEKKRIWFVFDKSEEDYFPTLRTLHLFPEILPKIQVDKGAIKFLFSGSDIMCKGLTSSGGLVEDDLDEGDLVAVMAEGKENALAIGRMVMSGAEIKEKNEGVGVKLLHVLNDGLWKVQALD